MHDLPPSCLLLAKSQQFIQLFLMTKKTHYFVKNFISFFNITAKIQNSEKNTIPQYDMTSMENNFQNTKPSCKLYSDEFISRLRLFPITSQIEFSEIKTSRYFQPSHKSFKFAYKLFLFIPVKHISLVLTHLLNIANQS